MKATVEGEGKSPEEMDTAIRQLVSRAVASEEVVDIFAAACLKKPDISILSDDFLQEVRQLPHRNLAGKNISRCRLGYLLNFQNSRLEFKRLVL